MAAIHKCIKLPSDFGFNLCVSVCVFFMNLPTPHHLFDQPPLVKSFRNYWKAAPSLKGAPLFLIIIENGPPRGGERQSITETIIESLKRKNVLILSAEGFVRPP